MTAQDVAGVIAELSKLIAVCEKAASDERRVLLDPAAVLPIAKSAHSSLESQAQALSEAEAERDLLRKYCSAAASDYLGVLASMRSVVGNQFADAFNALAAEFTETSEFMQLAAEGRANGLLYDDEWSKANKRALAAESRLAEAMRVIEPFALMAAASDFKNNKAFQAARDFLNAKEKT